MDNKQDFWRWMQRLTQGMSVGTFAVTVVLGVGAVAPDPVTLRHRAAMADYQAGHWPEAYQGLAALADAGDPDAARLAGLMVRQGPLLYGQRFDASPERQAAWARLTGAVRDAVHAAPRHAGRAGAETGARVAQVAQR